MDQHINFGKDEITTYFEKSTISTVYEDFYPVSHTLEDISASEADAMTDICGAIKKQLQILLIEKGKDVSYVKTNIYAEMIDGPQYDNATKRIRRQLGAAIANPYLEEYEIIGRLRRTTKVMLISIYNTSRKKLPKKMKDMLHQDHRKVKIKEFREFVAWLKKHPDKNIVQIDDMLKNYLDRLATRITDMDNFYHQHKEVADMVDKKTSFGSPTGEIVSVNEYRKQLIQYLNERFSPNKKAKKYETIK